MKFNHSQLTLAFLGITLIAAPAGFAQQQPNTSDQYQGVSQPPPDDTIVATPDTPPPPPVQAVKPKPSPYVAVPPPPPSASASETTAAPRYSTHSDAPVITTGPSVDTRRWDNTDYGIVTVPVPPGDDNPDVPTPDDTTVLHVRDNSTRLAAHAGSSNELPVGTQVRIRIDEALSTDETQVDAPFHGKVLVNVMHNGSVIIPAGSTLRGRVVQVSQGHHFGPAASLRLRPDIVILPDGTAYHLYGQVEASNADDTQIDDEGTIQPESHARRKGVEYGAGVGTGAIVGAALAGPPGALAGTIVGAGLVTTHLLMQHPNAAAISAGSDITFSLTEPLYLIPTRN